LKVLVAGWFSFEQLGATAGDLLTRDLVCRWLDAQGDAYDVALAYPFAGGVDWRAVDPRAYSRLIFVCGPFGNGPPLVHFLERFAHCQLIGVNLSMLESLETWNPFDFLLERDSSATSRPDLSFLSRQPLVPVVGIVRVHPQAEYRGGMHGVANDAIDRLCASREMALVQIDTRLDLNNSGLRTASEVESLIARMDAVITTRLHGMVLALKNGVPPLVIDPIAEGAKVLRQARVLEWSATFTADALCDSRLGDALDFCLSEQGKTAARLAAERATRLNGELAEQFGAVLRLEVQRRRDA
jgi:hypothetical protein